MSPQEKILHGATRLARNGGRRAALALVAGLLATTGIVACGDDDGTTQPVDHEAHPVAFLDVDRSELDLEIGETATLTATAMCEHQVEIHPTIGWATEDDGVATVDAQGTVSAVAFGSTTVTATAGSIHAHTGVAVAPEGAVVAAGGGTVASADGALTVEFPAGALSGPTDIVVEKLPDEDFMDDLLYVRGTAYRIRPDGLQLQERARLRLRFQEQAVPPGVPHERLRIQERDRDRDHWRETDENQLRIQEREVEARIERLGTFGIVPSHARTLGPQGGTVTSADGRATIEIPAGALTQERYVAIHRLGDGPYEGDPLYVRGTAYELTPDRLQLQERARLRIHYDPEDVPGDADRDRLRIHDRDPDQDRWRDRLHDQSCLDGVIEVEIEELGTFAVLASDGAVVGADGGTAVSADGALTLEFPAGALDADTDISIRKVDDALFSDDPLYVRGTAYDVSPDGLQLGERARLQIHYDPANVPGDMLHERLRIRLRDQDQQGWRQTQQHRLRRQEHVVEAEIEHLSIYAVVGLDAGEITVQSVTIEPPTASIAVGGTVQLEATPLDEDGLPLDRPVAWSSDDEAVATVSGAGQVTGVADGTANITAEVEGKTASAEVLVSSTTPPPPPPPEGTVATVTVTPSQASLQVGGTQQLTAVARDDDGNVLSRTFAWSSDDEAVATVSSAGLVSAVSEGTATVTASTGGVSGTAEVAVNPEVSSVVIDPIGNEPLEVGFTLQLVATAYDGVGTPVDATIAWSSSDEGVATVDETGLVSAVARGSATITAAVGTVSDAVEVRIVGESGTYGNNLSWPVVFVDGVGITGQPVDTDTGLRPLDAEGVEVDALPFFWEGNEPTFGIYHEQQTFNTWQAEWVDGGGEARYDASIAWGDNLTHQTWSASKPIRVEQVLSATGMTLTGYSMTYLYGQGPEEMQGTDGTTADFTPTIYTVGPTLKVEKIDGEGGSPVATVTDQAVGSEVNIAGKIIYGYNLRLSSWTPPQGVTLDGWYRITFELDGGANAVLRSVDNTDDELTYVPEISADGSRSWIDVLVTP